MKNLTTEKKILLIILMIGLLCALVLCGIRMGIEAKNDRVCIAMSEADLRLLAECSGLSGADEAAEILGIKIMELDELRAPGMLVEDREQLSYDTGFGAYVPDGDNTRIFWMRGGYAQRYEYLGLPGAQAINDVLYLAVTDRGIRLLYLFPIETVGGTAQITDLAVYQSVIAGLADRIAEHGLTLADEASSIAAYTPNAVLQYFTAVGVVCAALWLLLCVFPRFPRTWIYVLLVLGALLTAVLLRLLPQFFTEGFAFAAAVTAPCLALCVMWRAVLRPAPETKLAALGIYAKALFSGLGIAFAGGLIIAALQSSSGWLLSVDHFRGVKLSQTLPVVFAAFLALRDICRPKELLHGKLPLTVLGVLIILGGIGLFLFRTGNVVSSAIPTAELRFRAWLENLLIVRPRTKEFCIGWPCLALCMAALIHGHKRIAVPFSVFSAVSVSSVVNTFCHSRAPIWLSSVRGILGALIGCAVGMVLLILFTLLPLRKPR